MREIIKIGPSEEVTRDASNLRKWAETSCVRLSNLSGINTIHMRHCAGMLIRFEVENVNHPSFDYNLMFQNPTGASSHYSVSRKEMVDWLISKVKQQNQQNIWG